MCTIAGFSIPLENVSQAGVTSSLWSNLLLHIHSLFIEALTSHYPSHRSLPCSLSHGRHCFRSIPFLFRLFVDLFWFLSTLSHCCLFNEHFILIPFDLTVKPSVVSHHTAAILQVFACVHNEAINLSQSVMCTNSDDVRTVVPVSLLWPICVHIAR